MRTACRIGSSIWRVIQVQAPFGPSIAALRRWFDQETRLFIKGHPASWQRQRRCDAHYLFGMPMHWMRDWPNPHGLFISEARGARLQCVDGHSYIDFCLGDTGAMFGHSPPVLAQVLALQGHQGLTSMLPSAHTDELGERLAQVFGLPMWQLALSASDANRFVLRWVRAISQRKLVLVFDGCYHGAVDETLVQLDDDGQVRDGASVLGSAHSQAATTRVVPFNDVDAVRRALSDHKVAAVLAEPALTNCGLVLPDPDFWTQVQDICRQTGTLLVLDETHTISTACGGWARAHALVPDFLVIGKAIAGGLPCAVYGFTREMAQRMRSTKEAAQEGHSGIGNTLSGNMLTVAALHASLAQLHTGPNYMNMLAGAERLSQGLRQRIGQAGLPWSVSRLGARLELQFLPRAPRNAAEVRGADAQALEPLLHLFMLNRGVLLTPFHCMMLVCPAIRQGDIDALLAVFDEFLQTLSALRDEH